MKLVDLDKVKQLLKKNIRATALNFDGDVRWICESIADDRIDLWLNDALYFEKLNSYSLDKDGVTINASPLVTPRPQIVQQVELTNEAIDKIAEKVAEKLKLIQSP